MKSFDQMDRSLSELQGVPRGTFRCDVCKFVQSLHYLSGAVADTAGDNPVEYNVCHVCSAWLGLGKFHFPLGFSLNFSEKQREKIKALHKELEMVPKDLPLPYFADGRKKIYKFLRLMPNLREIIKLRSDYLTGPTIKDSYRLTRESSLGSSGLSR